MLQIYRFIFWEMLSSDSGGDMRKEMKNLVFFALECMVFISFLEKDYLF